MQTVKQGSFELAVGGQSYRFGGQAEFELDVTPLDQGTQVTVIGQASGLRSAFFELRYPAGTMHPVASDNLAWPEVTRERLLQLTVLDEPGRVQHGTVLARPQERPGVHGRFALLTVRFAAGPAAALRVLCAAPVAPVSAIPDLTADALTGDVSFSYYNVGDYNQNSQVEIADLTPLGVHYLEKSPDFPNAFPAASIGSVIDGDQNGEINISDLTPIGSNWSNDVTSWVLYGGTLADYPAGAAEDNGAAAQLGTIDFPAELAVDHRLVVAANVAGLVGLGELSVWLRPVGTGGVEGIPSNRVDLAATDTTPPVWDISPEGEGVIQVVPLDGGLRIIWGAATDESAFNYIGWVQPSGMVNYDDTPDFTVTPSDPPDPPTDQITEVTGLTNGTIYEVVVRARDEYGNETTNTNLLYGTPFTAAEVPAAISSDEAFSGPAKISAGNSVVVTGGAKLTFLSDFEIEPGGSLEAQDDLLINVKGNLVCDGAITQTLPEDLPGSPTDAPSLKVVIAGDVTFGPDSVVTGNGNIYLVDDAEELVEPSEVEDELDAAADPADFPFNLDYEEGAGPLGFKLSSVATKVVSRTVYHGPRPWTRWLVRGNWGKVPVQPRGVTRVVLRIWPLNGTLDFEDFSITGPDGRPGQDETSCNAHGGNGQDNNWRFRIHCGRTLNFRNVNIKLGNGGRGGNASTPQDCDPGVAVGGNGGKALNKFRFTAGGSINISGSFNFNPGNGGAGGTATAYGVTRPPACPAQDGGDAYATGGDGGDVPRWGVKTTGAVNGTGNVTLGIASGGVGGLATAWGGDGGNDTCCPGQKGGNGGIAEATGGNGGDSTFTDGGSGAGGGGATGGDGGAGHAAAGSGGNGASWFKIPAGDGGNGSDAVAIGGDAGEATGDGTLTQGNRGAAEAIGGNGGDGGDGLPPGVGGSGGTATADGNPATELQGVDGSDGDQSPLFLSEHIIIPGYSIPVGPVVPGVYVVPVYDNGSMEQIGSITLALTQEIPGQGSFDIVEYPGEILALKLTGGIASGVSLGIDKSTMVYLNPSDDAPWIGVDCQSMLTLGTCGLGFWFQTIPLDDYAIPENLIPSPQEASFNVSPALFYEHFPPDPLVPPQWDDCDVYCQASSSTEIIHIIVIDP